MKPQTLDEYNSVPDYIKYDLTEAINWAKETLTDFEGSGHDFQLSGVNNNSISCSFAKPEWKADYSGAYMDSASEAVVMSVCEYLSGGIYFD